MTQEFTWIPIYQELATVLSGWENRQSELIAFLDELHNSSEYVVSSMQDKNKDGERFLLQEIDPFTFFGVFNRGIKNENRIAILARMRSHFNLQSSVPSDFDAIPILNNQSSWFFSYQPKRTPEDIPRLWRLFQLALHENPLQQEEFQQAFDDALSVRKVNINLTMGLFWIRPYTFLSLDKPIRDFLSIKLPSRGLTASFYSRELEGARARGIPFPDLSLQAWKSGRSKPEQEVVPETDQDDRSYWLVGAYWPGSEPPDQTPRFVSEGIWENGYEDRYLDEVKSMHVGDKIAIKASATQRKDLPFDVHGETVSRMDIKAIGTIVANRGDGRTLEVEWEPNFEIKSWYFYTGRSTVWCLRTDEDYEQREYAKRLIEFVWGGQDQDYDWFLENMTRFEDLSEEGSPDDSDGSLQPYSLQDIIAAGAFLEESDLQRIMDRLRAKKAMILQGAPGVGKTYIARKVAYALMEQVDNSRLEMVQFHQSYSYDDFVRGYRPSPEEGGFVLQDGVFYEFCKRAEQDPEREYVFIIDEINRGNLSLIFGELLMLIEADKRDRDFAVPLVYRKQGEPRFFIPPNLYLIGLMNIADRSLAMVDYALRRRFAFVTLEPQFEGVRFRKWLIDRSMDNELVDLIITRMSALNHEIKDDPLLGENYQIGHSYFCPKGTDFSGLDRGWYNGIVETEITPLLKEYWFDNLQKADDAQAQLLA